MATNNVTNNYSPLTTKGDLFTYSTVNARLPVGSNGKMVIADSTQTAGLGYDYAVPLPTYFYQSICDLSNGAGGAEGSMSSSTSGTGATVNSGDINFTGGTRIGVNQSQTGTTTTGMASTALNGASTHIYSSNGQLLFETSILLDLLSDNTDTYTINCGFMPVNRTTIDQNNSIYFSYTNGTNSGKFQGNCRSGATPSTVDLGITVAAATWYTLAFIVNAANTLITFYINGTSAGTLNSNIPAGTIGQVPLNIILKSAGTTNITLATDWMRVRKDFTTPR